MCLPAQNGLLDPERLQSLVDQVQRLRAGGRKVVIVSSGAIGAGIGQLKLDRRPNDLRRLQACAAVGQGFLMRTYQECFGRHGAQVAQILLTASDFDNRTRYLNARNTILTLLEWDCIPIINENDTVSIAEIRFGIMITWPPWSPTFASPTVIANGCGRLCPIDPGTKRAEPLTTVPAIDGSIMDLAVPAGVVSEREECAATQGGLDWQRPPENRTTPRRCGRRPGRRFAGETVGTLFLPHGTMLPA